MKKKILAITGIRSEYDILFPILDILRKNKKFEVKVVVCGTHLSDWHNNSYRIIEQDGFEIADKIDYLLMSDRKTQRAKGTGTLLASLTQTVDRERPDFLIVVGDREESIATSIIGNYLNILVAHLAGGDPAHSHADGPVRFAVSKLSHIHFVFAKQHKKNLETIGEEKFRIFNVGNPRLDTIKSIPILSKHKVSKFLKFDITKNPYLVFIEHPLSFEKENTYFQVKVSLSAIEEFCNENGINAIGIYPNTDPGCFDIVKAIDEFKDSKHIKFFKMLPRDIFINLIRYARALAGNSSMGFLEAPFYKLPVVNIGNRQKGRINPGNVEFSGYEKKDIKNKLYKVCFNHKYRNKVKKLKDIYGDGESSKRIEAILSSINTKNKKWYVKEKLC